MVTMALARPTGRNKSLEISAEGFIVGNQHSTNDDQAWANACLFVMNKKVFGILNGNYELEKILIDQLADQEQIATYKHKGFWTPVETYRDRVAMENMWNAGMAPWIKNG